MTGLVSRYMNELLGRDEASNVDFKVEEIAPPAPPRLMGASVEKIETALAASLEKHQSLVRSIDVEISRLQVERENTLLVVRATEAALKEFGRTKKADSGLNIVNRQKLSEKAMEPSPGSPTKTTLKPSTFA